MTLKQLQDLQILDQDIIDAEHGCYYDKRTTKQLLDNGIVLLDKPPGPTSHEVVAWTKRMLDLPKIGHSGTLDPQVSGVLPLGLGNATKALGVLLFGTKEYVGIGRFHSMPSHQVLESLKNTFTGEIYQKPPQRSSVLRRTRIRTIYEIEIMEQKDSLVLMRTVCESGTYIRKLIYDMGEVMGSGASMIELRRTRVAQFGEEMGLVTMHALSNAYAVWKENDDDSKLRSMIHPVEDALGEIKSVIIRDSAVDALCHGAQLAIPGVLQIPRDLEKGDFVAIYTQKGEAVALANAIMDKDTISEGAKGHAFETRRIIMEPGTYKKSWRTRAVDPKSAKNRR
ncbi:MAG: tRNA pseudouridine synthase [Cenarchaeum symbiont of Oopsacas minuta]|nr:tRNA pseudouridine synthase [Cenarchaeum symbiont of Oopsacas minuta]